MMLYFITTSALHPVAYGLKRPGLPGTAYAIMKVRLQDWDPANSASQQWKHVAAAQGSAWDVHLEAVDGVDVHQVAALLAQHLRKLALEQPYLAHPQCAPPAFLS